MPDRTAQRLDKLEAGHREILTVLARIERVLTGGAEAASETVVVEALAVLFKSKSFTTAEALRKARAETAEARALRDALGTNGIGGDRADEDKEEHPAHKLGHLLKRAERNPTGPYIVVRVGKCHNVARWSIRGVVLGNLQSITPLRAS